MSTFQILGAQSGSCERGPWARVVGRAADGASAAVTVHGLLPYFYLKLTHGLLRADGQPNDVLLEALVIDLNRHLNERVRADQKHTFDCDGIVAGGRRLWRLVNSAHVVFRHDFYGFSPRPHAYARLEFTSLGAHREARWALADALGGDKRAPALRAHVLERLFPGRLDDVRAACRRERGVRRKGLQLVLAEANTDFHDQVMDQLDLKPGGWCAAQLRASRDRPDTKADVVAVDVSLTAPKDMKLGALKAAVRPLEVARAAPVRVLAWDLEVYCVPLGDGAMKFFNGDDPGAKLLCVSAVTFDYGVADSLRSVVFSLGHAPAAATQETATDGSTIDVRWFGDDEPGLIRDFFLHVRHTDPDVLTGYNTFGFDWPWLCKRACVLEVDLHPLARWGCVVFDESDKARQVVVVPGREVHDLMVWMRKNRQLREYTLEYVSTENGLAGKDDVKYSDIASLFQTHEGRVKLAVYCEMDSRLVCQLMQKPQLDPLGKALAIAAITGVTPEHILHRGSMHTLRLAMLRASHASGFVLSCPSRSSEASSQPSLAEDDEDEARFQGGKVLQPITGFYRDPIVTLDFGSLYPSCMWYVSSRRARPRLTHSDSELNICSSSRLTRAEAKFGGLAYTQPPAPSLTGVWYCGLDKVARVHEVADDDIIIYTYAAKKAVVARYTDQLNESITLPSGDVWLLQDGGYKLLCSPDVMWHRADKDVLCMVDASVMEGVIPKLERELKIQRESAKKNLARAEKTGVKADIIFLDNLQQGATSAHLRPTRGSPNAQVLNY